MLSDAGIKHEVLNAKQHEKEAEIIAQAGKYGAVTIATNMAGRGTDIMLGGNSEYLAKQQLRMEKYTPEQVEEATTYYETDDEQIKKEREHYKEVRDAYEEKIKDEKQKVIDAGGLKIIGTERHESRRIDNQLRGRSGRQGDPGESRFYISLEDDLMKIFGGDRIISVYEKLDADEDMPINSKLISKAVERAQKKVEGKNFSIRKHVLQYDDVMNSQREIIYAQRKQVLDGENLKSNVTNMIDDSIERLVNAYNGEDGIDNSEALLQDIQNSFGIAEVASLKAKANAEEVIEELQSKAHEIYEAKETEFGEENMRELERVVILKVVDQKWMDHIDDMDELKNGIGLRAYAQKDPVVQYRLEGADMFDDMIEDLKDDVAKIMLNIEKRDENAQREETAEITGAGLEDTAINLVDGTVKPKEGGLNKTVVKTEPKVGRNDPCPCGSGKKYKNCHGKNA